jgi:uncharacterized membrane protein
VSEDGETPPGEAQQAELERKEAERNMRAAERLTIFSDAVVAIAMTLLAIELPVPEGHTVPEFFASVRHNDGHYAAFLISFSVIAAVWNDHHDLFRYVNGVDARVRLYNTYWLLTIVLNPFATDMLVASGQSLGTHALRFGFYALLQVLESAAMYAMVRHMVSDGLIDLPPDRARRVMRGSTRLMIGFALSIPVFWLTTYGWILWFLGPILAYRTSHRHQPDPAPGIPPGPAA